MYDAFVRFIYRIIAPGHPRGRVQIHAVPDKSPGTLWIRTHGMNKYGLDEVEFVAVPTELRGYAHGLLFEIIGYMKSRMPILADQSIGGLWLSEDQPAYHNATARLALRPGDPDHSRALRFVDHEAPVTAEFPGRLFSAHISGIAAQAGSATQREKLFWIACRLATDSDQIDTDDPRDNINNWVAWEGLGSALCDLGRIAEGIYCLSTAAERSTKSMRSLACLFRMAIDEGELPAVDSDPRSLFWYRLGT